ncbi:24766_t:CDS:2 [Entrophospora sp. SA101]|nr:24766_t:CDS:2 [Entrophospora sp. SA101]
MSPPEKYSLNTKQSGEALELLSNLENNSVSLVFLDPQYEPVRNVLRTNYPLYSQSDYQILRILEQAERVLKPSAFLDFLVWHKKNTLGLGNWLRSNAEFCFLIQKSPQSGKLFKNRSFGNVWEENVLPPSKRKHPHQKPRELIKSLITATTEKGDLIVDPCAGSFIVLEVCQELEREFCGYMRHHGKQTISQISSSPVPTKTFTKKQEPRPATFPEVKLEEVRYLDNQELKTKKPTEKDFFIGCPDEDGVSIDEKGVSLKARDIGCDGFEAGVISAETKAGIDLDNRVSSDLRAGTEGVSAKVGIGTDLASAEAETGVKANVGIKADTGFKVEDDEMEADLGGFGVKVGKETGVETPFGGFSVDLEKLGPITVKNIKILTSKCQRCKGELDNKDKRIYVGALTP